MKTFVDLFWVVLKAVPTAVISPFISYIFWIIVLLVYSQYKRVETMEVGIHGIALNKALPQTLQAIGYGLVGGILGTLIMVYIGVSPYTTSFGSLLALALALYLIHPRFVCFSYAAAILSLLSLATGWPHLYVPGVVAIVAVLHVTESFLMLVSGASCSTPLYVRNRVGRVVAGFSLQRFWPIPLAVLVLGTMPEVGEAIPMPDWWPLVLPPASVPLDASDLAFLIFPVVAALGYSDVAITMPPGQKCRRSALNLAIYSVILLLLAIASSRNPAIQWGAALFSGIGHEAVVHLGSRRELRGHAYLSAPARGVMVLDVIPESPAERAGLRTGDVVRRVDGDEVNCLYDLRRALDLAGEHVHLAVVGDRGEGEVRYLRSALWEGTLGAIFVPEPGSGFHVEMGSQMPLKRLIRRFRKGISRR